MGYKLAGLVCLMLGGCANSVAVTRTDNPDPLYFTELIEVADNGRCFAQASGQVTLADFRVNPDISPADDVAVQPVVAEEEPVILTPAHAEEEPVILSPDAPVLYFSDEASEFEAVCPAELTPDFVSSLQRAMAARDGYSGQITGEYDATTAASVLLMQRETLDLNSEVLAMETAQTLGLIVLSSDDVGSLF